MKFLLILPILLFAACSPNADYTDAPSNVQLSADAILAKQAAETASARSNALDAQIQAARTATQDVRVAKITEAAMTLEFARVTGTAEANTILQANAQKTEDAHGIETVQRHIETYVAQTATAAANQTATRKAEDNDTATAIAHQNETANAQSFASETAAAARKTDTYLGELAVIERGKRQQELKIQQERDAMELSLAPATAFAGTLINLATAPCAIGLIVLVFGVGLWKILSALATFIQAQTVTTAAANAKGMLVLDSTNEPIGYFKLSRGNYIFEDIRPEYIEPDDDPPPQSPRLLTDAKEHTSEVKQIAPPPEPLIGDFVYPSTVRAFAQAILATGDWSQHTWRDRELPRGFILSMDTEDAQGNRVYGGYSRMIQLFVDRHLIINRRRGRSGDWNPNVPKDINGVMAIILNEAPLPAIQAPAPPPEPPPSPIKRKRAKIPAVS